MLFYFFVIFQNEDNSLKDDYKLFYFDWNYDSMDTLFKIGESLWHVQVFQ